jgi:hypothetical protein
MYQETGCTCSWLSGGCPKAVFLNRQAAAFVKTAPSSYKQRIYWAVVSKDKSHCPKACIPCISECALDTFL